MAKAQKDTGSTGGEEKKGSYIVVKEFHDINNFSTVYKPGDDVSHFDPDRLGRLIKSEAVEIKGNDK